MQSRFNSNIQIKIINCTANCSFGEFINVSYINEKETIERQGNRESGRGEERERGGMERNIVGNGEDREREGEWRRERWEGNAEERSRVQSRMCLYATDVIF